MSEGKTEQGAKQQIGIDGGLNLILGGNYGQVPLLINLGPQTQKIVEKLSQSLWEDRAIETKAVQCKGANNQLSDVTALVTFKTRSDPEVRCPRLKSDLLYISDIGGSEREHYRDFCYCVEDPQVEVPVVREEEFAGSHIYPCPYTGRHGRH